jgi:wyosine [tRNA(Phe)-imidazoG37] synthetase (radical SAM superfamily)
LKKSKQTPPLFHIYGPVPSRRLGFSLGVDIIPFKTCSLNCIYCQLGPTLKKTTKREECIPSSKILPEIKRALHSAKRIDYITFSGSGEPTLNSAIGEIIRKIKKTTSIPVAVLTNSTLLTRKRVREALLAADLVVPSLDAVTQDVFLKINRPHPTLKIKEIIEGLRKFRQEFKGALWLEVMLVQGVNDSPIHIKKLKEATTKINPDKIQLNTVIRPPAEKFARPLTHKEMKKIRETIGKKCEIIIPFEKKEQPPASENIRSSIHSLLQRRPATLSDIASSLGKHKNEIIKHLNVLLEEGKVKAVVHRDQRYYEPA